MAKKCQVFGNFFDIQTAIFRRVSLEHHLPLHVSTDVNVARWRVGRRVQTGNPNPPSATPCVHRRKCSEMASWHESSDRCSCDTLCYAYGDCCPDFETWCPHEVAGALKLIANWTEFKPRCIHGLYKVSVISTITNTNIFFSSLVFKSQYFLSYARKTDFLPFTYIFQRTVTHSKIVRLTRLFFYRFRTF